MPTIDSDVIYLSDILLTRDPVKANHAATKQYVDNQLTTVAPLTHTHSTTDLTGLGTAALADTGTGEGDVPVLDADGKISTAVLPALAISDTFVVASEAAMLALTAETGDIAIRTDLEKSFILAGNDSSLLADWRELLTPTDAVASVNGRTGAVTITLAELGGVATDAKGAANGIAPLDANGQVPVANLPADVLVSANRFRTTFAGNGTDTQIEITHNLGSSEVEVQVFLSASMTPVHVAYRPTSANALSLLFAAAPTAESEFIVIVRK